MYDKEYLENNLKKFLTKWDIVNNHIFDLDMRTKTIPYGKSLIKMTVDPHVNSSPYNYDNNFEIHFCIENFDEGSISVDDLTDILNEEFGFENVTSMFHGVVLTSNRNEIAEIFDMTIEKISVSQNYQIKDKSDSRDVSVKVLHDGNSEEFLNFIKQFNKTSIYNDHILLSH